MQKSQKILLVSNIVLVGFVLAVFFHYIIGFYLGGVYPVNTFLGNPHDAPTDFTSLIVAISNFSPYDKVALWVNYLPLAYILYFPFVLINNNMISYLIYLMIFLSFLIYANTKILKCQENNFIQNFSNIFIMTFLSYPVLITIERGNIDAILLIFFAAFVFLFKKEKYYLSAFFLALINGMKPFTILFLFLFLLKKRYKEFFFSIILSVFMIIGGFIVLKGDFFNQVSNLILNVYSTKHMYVYENNNTLGMLNSSSLFMALKLIFCKLTVKPLITTSALSKIYDVITCFLNIIILFFVAKENVFWKKIALLTFSMLLIPYLVNDYKYIFLFVPLWLFFNAKESKFDLAYCVLFALLLIPKNIVVMNYPLAHSAFSVSTILNPLIMLVFAGLIIFDYLRSCKRV